MEAGGSPVDKPIQIRCNSTNRCYRTESTWVAGQVLQNQKKVTWNENTWIVCESCIEPALSQHYPQQIRCLKERHESRACQVQVYPTVSRNYCCAPYAIQIYVPYENIYIPQVLLSAHQCCFSGFTGVDRFSTLNASAFCLSDVEFSR